jgi:hypothetical protein
MADSSAKQARGEVGGAAVVKREIFGRGGQSGMIVGSYREGLSIDFFCDCFGDPRGLPSIEFFEYGELEWWTQRS